MTIVEVGSPKLMGREDPDASHEIRRILTDEGVQIHVPAELLKVSRGQSGNGVSVTASAHEFRRTNHRSAATSWSPRDAFRNHRRNRRSARPVHRPWTTGGLCPRQRAARDERAGRLGARRMRRQPAGHPHIRRRLSHRSRQSGRRSAEHARPADSLLHVHRSAAGACWIEPNAKRSVRASRRASPSCR